MEAYVCVCVNHRGIPQFLVNQLVKRFPELVKKLRAIFKTTSSQNVREKKEWWTKEKINLKLHLKGPNGAEVLQYMLVYGT